jgi:hypothetical protein
MTTTTIEFNLLDASRPFAPQRYRIGLVVRGMSAPGRRPDSEGHADCVLPFGVPIGFFADTAPAASGLDGSGSFPGGSSAGDSAAGSMVVGGALTFAFTGMVYSYADFLRDRPHYVRRDLARSQNEPSTLLVIDVTAEEARRFENAWASMRRDPGQFGIVGMNCATHAGWAFACAGLLMTPAGALPPARTSEITGMDTPTDLYRQLVEGPANSRFESYSGYLGFEPMSHGQYRVQIDSL